jgi:predicted solute-binding protein
MGWWHVNGKIFASRRCTSQFSSRGDKLFATMHAVISSSTSTYSVFLFTTFSNEDGIINHRTTERAETHRSICSPMIKVGAPISLHYHHSPYLPIYDY